MRLSTQRVSWVLCLLLGVAATPAEARDDVLTTIPDDAAVFAVVHNLGDVSTSIGEVAKLLQRRLPIFSPWPRELPAFKKELTSKATWRSYSPVLSLLPST